jgi:hypothetical protein
MTKGELKHIRPWNERPSFVGKPGSTVQKIALYIHESYQLQDYRRSIGVRVNRSREITTGQDKEWFLEAIAVATRYLANTKTILTEEKTGEEKQLMLNALAESERWLGIARLSVAFFE